MKIKIVSEFKSITELNDIELPSFVVLSGLNGAGKTQLLQAISSKKAVMEINGVAATKIKIYSGGFGVVAAKTFYANKLEQFAIQLQEKVSSYNYHSKQSPGLIYYKYETFFTKLEQDILSSIRRSQKNPQVDLPYVNRMEVMRHIPPGTVINEVQSGNGLSQGSLETQDIFNYDLSQIFKHYHFLQQQNDYHCYLKERKGKEDLEALSQEEFIAKHGEPPWTLANEILASARIGFSLTTPENQGEDDPFTVKLINQLNSLEINLDDLSSGEKVIMSLAFALYNSHYERTYPEVLLLDEPDCHLHPSMAGSLLRVIEDVFVKSRNVSVIMTTHSPSTVALTPDGALYAMSNTLGRISKQSKDRCIKILTAGVPALSVNFDSRLQVFVESKHDARNYGDVYEAIKERLNSDLSLSFIPSGTGGSGSAAQVRDIVGVLRRNGVNRVYGVIDWDGANADGEFVTVISYGRRYSLENLILDPLLIGIYLIREAHLRPEAAGLDAKISYIQVANLRPDDCEKLAAYVVGEIEKSLPDSIAASTEVRYVGNFQIAMKRWILEMNGHELEEAIKNTFPPLQRFRSENDLKSDVIKKVVTDLPQFVPYDFIELFDSIFSKHLD